MKKCKCGNTDRLMGFRWDDIDEYICNECDNVIYTGESDIYWVRTDELAIASDNDFRGLELIIED